jgi:hypothetical protein
MTLAEYTSSTDWTNCVRPYTLFSCSTKEAVMSPVFAIIVFIALNVVPLDLDSFQIVDPAGRGGDGQRIEKVVEFTRQPDGAWRAVDLPLDEIGAYAVNGESLTVSPPAGEQARGAPPKMAMDMARIIDIGPGTDWATMREVSIKTGGMATLSRQPGQVTVDMMAPAGVDARKRSFQIRWKAKKPE